MQYALTDFSPIRLLAAVVQGLALALAAGACAAAPLTLAVADLPSFAPVLVAESRDLFAQEGLELKIVHCVNGRRCLDRLVAGEAQLATVADMPIVMASFSHRDFTILGTFTTSNNENQMVARADRGIRTPADLRGKRIGVVKGTSGQYFTEQFLLFNGMGPNDVTLVGVDPADAAAPLVRGEVDAVGSYNPMGYRARSALGANAVTLTIPRLYTATFNLVATRTAPGVSDADAAKVLRAIARAVRYMRAEPIASRQIVANRLSLDPAMVDSIWSDYRFSLSLDQSLLNTLEAQSRWAQREGLGGKGPPPDYLDFIRPSPLRSIDRSAVTLMD